MYAYSSRKRISNQWWKAVLVYNGVTVKSMIQGLEQINKKRLRLDLSSNVEKSMCTFLAKMKKVKLSKTRDLGLLNN